MGRTPDHWKTSSRRPNGLMARPGTESSNPSPSSGESLSPGAAFGVREPRLSARLCAAGLATGSAETHRVFQDRANRRQYLCRAIFQYRSAVDGVGEVATPVPIKAGWSPSLIVRDLCARTGLNQSPARSADRARQAAGVSARGASL